MSEDLPTAHGRRISIVSMAVSSVVLAGGGATTLAAHERLTRAEVRIEQLEADGRASRMELEETDRRARANEAVIVEVRSAMSEIRADVRETRDTLTALCARTRCR